MRLFPNPGHAARAGFTLIEILAVLIIITILFTFIVTRVIRGEDIVKAENTRAFLQQASALIAEYEQDQGDYPASTFPSDMDHKPTKANEGSEMLVMALFAKDRGVREIDEARLCNTDLDELKASMTSFSSPEVFELADDWENPIAYFHRRDYSKRKLYVTFDANTGEMLETEVTALVSSKTGDPFRKSTFQLISAGPDGAFGTEDDLANFALEP